MALTARWHAPVGAAVAAVLLAAAPALADEIDQCREFGDSELAAEGIVGHVEIDKEAVFFDKAEVNVGSQFVSSVLHGDARLFYEGGDRPIRFLCLHGGIGVGPLFFWMLPE